MAHKHSYGKPASETALIVRCSCGQRAPLYRVDHVAYRAALAAIAVLTAANR